MKLHLITLTAVALSTPVWAQKTNEVNKPKTEEYGEKPERVYKQREWTAEEKAAMDERRLQILEKTLKEIGVTEDQKLRIIDLQKKLKEQMRSSFHSIEAKKKHLSELEKNGATEEEIGAAIDQVCDAQADQMKILARNRMQMEQILGKDRFKLFMDSARNKWREHGRHSGSGVPPKPGFPPIPTDSNTKTAPTPPSGAPPIH